MSEYLLGIDWGSTNRRAYLLDGAGQCVRSHADSEGMLAARGRFAESLAELCRALAVPAGTRVVMSGMVGSAQGWQEVAYLTPDVPLADLPRYLTRLASVGRAAAIVPGYCQRDGSIDVMRGEETQLLGAVALGHGDGWFILPGTHSKWALLAGGRLSRWSTYMTGELFAMLGQGGTLAPLMGASVPGDRPRTGTVPSPSAVVDQGTVSVRGQSPDAAPDAGAFEEGLAQARAAVPLTHSLFSVRARVVTGNLPAEQARSFISGLLIGAEFVASAPAADGLLTIIGSPELARRYQDAAAFFGQRTHTIDPDRAYCAALARFLPAKVAP